MTRSERGRKERTSDEGRSAVARREVTKVNADEQEEEEELANDATCESL